MMHNLCMKLLLRLWHRFEEKLVAQTYDGAAMMASALNGLQAKVKAVAPLLSAVFVHCFAHRLNLVLSQGVKSIQCCQSQPEEMN